MSISGDLVEWSRERPKWQQDAMRRFATRQTFSREDEDQIISILKAEHGAKPPVGVEAHPLDERHLPEKQGTDGPVQLASVGKMENVNRLAGAQTLHFAITGLTAVYGDNGSGKSGYVRILKQVCRTRDPDPVLPDVYKAGETSPPRATVRYRMSPTETEVKEDVWVNGQEFASALSQISVFDSRIASITVDKENELAFVPFGLDVFDKLGELCDRIKDRLTTERNALAKRIADLRQGLDADRDVQGALDKLSAKTKDADLERLSAWSGADADRLASVDLMLNDPVNQAKLLRARKSRCESLLKRVTGALAVVDDEAASQLRQKKEDVAAAKEAVRLSSIEAFAAEPLAGVGTDPWRVMYDAARAFSVEQAYVGRDFPAAEPGDLCVLCQQPLNDLARDRLAHFESFVRKDVEAKAKAAELALAGAVAAIEAALAELSSVETEATASDPADGDWAAALSVIALVLKERALVLQRAAGGGAWPDIPVLPDFDPVAAAAWPDKLEALALAHDAALDPVRRSELVAERANLKARKAFSENKTTVIILRDLLVEDAVYAKCIAAMATNSISKKRKEMDEIHVQGSLRSKLEEELRALRLTSIPVNIGFKVSKAKSRHKVQLDGLVAAAEVRQVVSEGEYRAVALACFLAQVRQRSNNAGIIVDDPVSSLDHDRRELVAERLVREARNRQVVVFTHDLVFLHMLAQKAEEYRLAPAFNSLRRTSVDCGIIEGSVPWNAMRLKERLHHLEHVEIKALSGIADQTSDEYRRQVTAVAEMIRRTWERFVEEVVLNGVITRFSQDIHTKQLDGVSVTDETVDRIWWEYKRVSNWAGHDEAVPKNSPLPTVDDLKRQITEIRSCQLYVEDNRKKVDAGRKESRKARLPEFV
jgi:energy-coupling factor transporter ATP-binding protein EcfA2